MELIGMAMILYVCIYGIRTYMEVRTNRKMLKVLKPYTKLLKKMTPVIEKSIKEMMEEEI